MMLSNEGKHGLEIMAEDRRIIEKIAEYSKTDVFLTTDKNLLRTAGRLKLDIITVNPLNWLKEVQIYG